MHITILLSVVYKLQTHQEIYFTTARNCIKYTMQSGKTINYNYYNIDNKIQSMEKLNKTNLQI